MFPSHLQEHLGRPPDLGHVLPAAVVDLDADLLALQLAHELGRHVPELAPPVNKVENHNGPSATMVVLYGNDGYYQLTCERIVMAGGKHMTGEGAHFPVLVKVGDWLCR